MAAQGDRRIVAMIKAALGSRILNVAAHTIAEFYRGGTRSAAEARLLQAWHVQFLIIDAADGKTAGELLAATGGSNSMDALLVAVAHSNRAKEIWTSDPSDIQKLAAVVSRKMSTSLTVVDVR